ncbi:MAG: hypothetical protein Q7S16_03790 [bacterium]|nr:hypothetical protein [bacterium]
MLIRDNMITRDVIAIAVRRERTPVCVRIDEHVGKEQLAYLAKLGVAFLIDWREVQSALFTLALHDYPRHGFFLDGRSVAEGEHSAFLTALGGAGVDGCIIRHVSNTFLEQCRKTERFVFVELNPSLSMATLPQKINELLGKSKIYRRGHRNVGGAVDMRHAPIFSVLEKYAREFPLFISCDPIDFGDETYVIPGAITVAPGMRIVMLPAPPTEGSDGWRDEFGTVAKQLAGTLQDAIAASR